MSRAIRSPYSFTLGHATTVLFERSHEHGHLGRVMDGYGPYDIGQRVVVPVGTPTYDREYMMGGTPHRNCQACGQWREVTDAIATRPPYVEGVAVRHHNRELYWWCERCMTKLGTGAAEALVYGSVPSVRIDLRQE